MNGYERRSTMKREVIEKATFELLNAGGVKELRIKDVAAKAGTSPTSIYNYYGSKENLIYEVMRGFYEQQVQKMKNLINSEEPFIDQLNDVFLQKPNNTNLLKTDIVKEILIANSDLNLLVQEYQQQTVPIFLEWIDKGRRQGYVREDIPNEIILYYYNMMAVSMETLYKQLANHPSVEQIFQQIKHIFFYGFIQEN